MSTDADVRDALRAYATCAIEALHDSGFTLPPVDYRGGWTRITKDLFEYRGSGFGVLLPTDRTLLRDLAELEGCTTVMAEHPVIGPRIDNLVGSVLGAQQLQTEGVVDALVAWMLVELESVAFDARAFESASDRVMRWLTRAAESWGVVAPLPGLVLDGPIELEPGLTIGDMTDDEVVDWLSAGLGAGIAIETLPIASIRSRVALRFREELPLVVGDSPDEGGGTYWSGWERLVEEVVLTLRLVKHGVISSPGFIARGDFLLGARGGTFRQSATPRLGSFGRYRLDTSETNAFRDLWRQVRSKPVWSDKALAIAIRRFGLVDERRHAEDKIIDLMVAAEALFLPGESGESAHKLSLRAAVLLAEYSSEEARYVATVMKRAYAARSAVAHGGEPSNLKLPDGQPTSLDQYVDVVSGYMRDALRHVVAATASGRPSPHDDWDGFVYSRLGSVGANAL